MYVSHYNLQSQSLPIFFFLNKLFSDAYYKCMTTDPSDYCFSQWAFIVAFNKYLKRGNLNQILDNTLSSLYPMYLDIEKYLTWKNFTFHIKSTL